MTLSVLTLVGVTGHFISYTFIVVIVRDVVGVHGPHLAWLLAGFGIAGLLAMAVMATPSDRRPKASVIGCLAALGVAFTVLAALAGGRLADVTTIAVGAAAIIVWGAASTALAPILQAAAMRTAPTTPTARQACTSRPSRSASWPGRCSAGCSMSMRVWRR